MRQVHECGPKGGAQAYRQPRAPGLQAQMHVDMRNTCILHDMVQAHSVAMGAVPTDRGEGCNTQPMAEKHPRRGHCMGASRQPQSLETEKTLQQGVGRRYAEGRLPAGPEYTACSCKLSHSPKKRPQTSQTDRGLHASPGSCMRASQSPMPPPPCIASPEQSQGL